MAPNSNDIVNKESPTTKKSSSNCGPAHLRHRRCTLSCNDRLAVDNCGCTLTPDPDPESAAALFAVPLCDEQKVRQCVHPHLQQNADAYLQCVKECKIECNNKEGGNVGFVGGKKSFTLKSHATSLVDDDIVSAKDVVEMNLSFLGGTGGQSSTSKLPSINSRPVNADLDAHQFVYVWVPIMVIAVLLVAFILCYCARRLM